MKKTTLLTLLITTLLFACKKDKPPVAEPVATTPTITANSFLLVCNEGVFPNGEASISRVETDGSVTLDMFKTANNRPLGNVAQSITYIDNKYYIAVNGSAKIEVVNAPDFKSITTLRGISSPRYILPIGNNKAYVSNLKLTNTTNYVYEINTQTNTITDSIMINGWSEKMVQVRNKVYVTNVSNNYLYVINTVTNTVESTITLSEAVTDIAKDNANNVWVLCGDYNTQPNSVAYVNTSTNTVTQTINFTSVSDHMHIAYDATHDDIYLLKGDILKLNKITNAFQTVVAKGTHVFYNFNIDTKNNQLILCDALDFSQRGYVYKYDLTNYTLLSTTKVGEIPSEVLVR
ncbi:MAG: hypothetical protein ABL940_03400 [Bacteroidia bacterium]